ncbi:hypothetical protein H8D57_00260 [bacterium]|nr:hypothetical protein [bacterium]
MRITHQGMVENIIVNIQERIKKVSEVQEQMSSGIRVSKSSDDPVAAAEILNLRSTNRREQQYSKNIERALSSMQMSETIIDDIRTAMSSARASAVRGANEAIGTNGRISIAHEINQKMSIMLHQVNQIFDNRYLFGGTNASGTPYHYEEDESGWLSSINQQFEESPDGMELLVEDGQRMNVSVTYDDFMNLEDGETIFGLLFDLRDGLTGDDPDAVAETLERFDTALEMLSAATASIGTRTQGLYQIQEQLENKEMITRERISNLADVDIVDAITRFQDEQNAYEVALKTAATAIRSSLIDFL